MLEKPNLDDATIIASLRDGYALPVTSIEFLPIGNDATAWVYKVSADTGTDYFLKVKCGAIYVPSVDIPRYLKDQGIEQVVAPMPTQTQSLWTPLDDFNLILYPFIDGTSGRQIGMTGDQWTELGSTLKRLHSAQFPAALAGQLERESFIPKARSLVKALQETIKSRDYDSPIERELAAYWKSKSDEIDLIVDRTDALGQRLQKQALSFVLCHTDIHTANVLLDKADGIHIVDWDGPLLAPKERDLMFLVGGVVAGIDVGNAAVEAVLRGYGQRDINPVAIAYYRYEWVVQEFGDYGNRVFLTDDLGEDSKREAVGAFRQLFDPGDVVDQAYRSIKDF